MFTGLIEGVGEIVSLQLIGRAAVLTVKTGLSLRGMELGASIAVNGACLTVLKKGKGIFTVDMSPETLKRTSLKDLRPGSFVT
jgi:riboflavin synthase